MNNILKELQLGDDTLGKYLSNFPPKMQAELLKRNLDSFIKKFKQFVDAGESKDRAFDSLVQIVKIIEELEKKNG